MCNQNFYFGIDWLKDEIKPIMSTTSIGYFRPWQQYCVIAPPQFASPDEVHWLWIYFKIVHHSQVLLSSTFNSIYYFN